MFPRRSLFLVLVALGFTRHLDAQRAPKEVDAWVRQTLARMGQPGVAIAVVKDGRVVFQQGWGVRRMGDPAPVDEHTRFQVASNTKAMTAASLALLVEEGKLRWDAPVRDYLPWFRLGGDPYISAQLTVQDLLCHRSGLSLGAGDLLWLNSSYTSGEIARRLRHIAPAASFRSAYAYDNVLYIVAGELVEAVAGMPWRDFVRRRILEPAGMEETALGLDDPRLGDNVALPHGRMKDTLAVVGYDSIANALAAGGAVSSAADWARWVRVQLDSGRVDSTRRLWPPAQTRIMWEPAITVPAGSATGPLAALRPNFSSYALGWFVRDYRGRKIVTHTGGLAGMLSRVFLVPEERLGIVVLTNGETLAFNALGYWLLDYYLGMRGPRTDWTGAYLEASALMTNRDRAFEDSARTARRGDVGPSLPIERYAGRYRDAWYGDASLALEHGHLVLHWAPAPAMTMDLEHWQYDTFRARARVPNIADAFVTFALGPAGTVERMTLVPALPSTDFSFNYQDLLFRPVPPETGGAAQ